jgi:putative transcriptional regulator
MTKTTKLGEAEHDTEFGASLICGLQEAIAYKRGEIALMRRVINVMPAERVKAIRKGVARFGVPARTMEGWEQGRKLDVAGRILLTVIERNPDAVEKAVAEAAAGSQNDD